jgi:glutamate/tyrosine decarboxylase-like PLP-dependent enzyme
MGVKRPDLPRIDFDWDAATWRAAAERFIDLARDATVDVASRPPAPTHPVRADTFRTSDGNAPRSIDELIELLAAELLPSSAYNGHPRFMAYITSSPLPVGVLGDMLASAINANVGLWRLAPAATAIELDTIDWIKKMVGYPDSAEGVFVSGGQFANILAHAVFREAKTPWDTRAHGMRGPDGNAPPVRVYAGQEVHYCHEQAAEFLGMGRETVRLVPSDDAYRMRVDALAQMIAEDRARGDLPLAIAATAGTVGTGAVDPLRDLAAVAATEDLWLHVDGAYGAFAAGVPSAPEDLRALSLADSIACDPHKWLYAPIDAGVTLVREPGLLQAAFSFHPAYLETEAVEGHADMVERTPENSRRFRALKVWLAAQLYGHAGFREMIERDIQLAAYMEQQVVETPPLVLAAPRSLSIVCWRVEPPGYGDAAALDRLQTAVIAELEARGIAVVSNAKLRDGRTAIRACIVNFRTSADDVEAVVHASAEIGAELVVRAAV